MSPTCLRNITRTPSSIICVENDILFPRETLGRRGRRKSVEGNSRKRYSLPGRCCRPRDVFRRRCVLKVWILFSTPTFVVQNTRSNPVPVWRVRFRLTRHDQNYNTPEHECPLVLLLRTVLRRLSNAWKIVFRMGMSRGGKIRRVFRRRRRSLRQNFQDGRRRDETGFSTAVTRASFRVPSDVLMFYFTR